MNEKDANELRNVAHEIIIKLWKANQTAHLDLLMAHCQKAIEAIVTASEEPPCTPSR